MVGSDRLNVPAIDKLRTKGGGGGHRGSRYKTLCHRYPWVKNSVLSTLASETLSSVPLGQALRHRYP